MKKTLYEEDLYPVIRQHFEKQGYTTTAHFYQYGCEHDVVAVKLGESPHVIEIEAKRALWLGKWEQCFQQAWIRRYMADKSYTAFPSEKANELMQDKEKMEKIGETWPGIGVIGVLLQSEQSEDGCVILKEAEEGEIHEYVRRKACYEILEAKNQRNRRAKQRSLREVIEE